ncbi:EF-hand domain-containing protein [Marilutibacter maris]|uniref:EF-hand domain-containing protein n=1 Tax=Marilutibacter maris TaxID=1605891 RepID=UPI000DAA281C|nr:EF-hand domain-containing protein [Lysobacter maris]
MRSTSSPLLLDAVPRALTVPVAALLLTWAAAATAQVQATGDYLSRMDEDQDGRVSLAEYQNWMSYAFEHMDRNGDGILSADELPGGRGEPVSLDEHRTKLARTFLRQDQDKDGFLDARELAAPPL